MTTLQQRINKRQIVIQKLNEKQEEDLALLMGVDYSQFKAKKVPNIVMKVVFSVLGVNAERVFRKHKATGLINRKRENVQARFAYFYFYKKYGDKPNSLSKIGQIKLGDKVVATYDHSTVIHGVQSWSDWCDTDKTILEKSQRIDVTLKSILLNS